MRLRLLHPMEVAAVRWAAWGSFGQVRILQEEMAPI